MSDTALVIFVIGAMFSFRVVVVSECYIVAIRKVEKIIRDAEDDPGALTVNTRYWTNRLAVHHPEYLCDLAAWNKWTPRKSGD